MLQTTDGNVSQIMLISCHTCTYQRKQTKVIHLLCIFHSALDKKLMYMYFDSVTNSPKLFIPYCLPGLFVTNAQYKTNQEMLDKYSHQIHSMIKNHD